MKRFNLKRITGQAWLLKFLPFPFILGVSGCSQSFIARSLLSLDKSLEWTPPGNVHPATTAIHMTAHLKYQLAHKQVKDLSIGVAFEGPGANSCRILNSLRNPQTLNESEFPLLPPGSLAFFNLGMANSIGDFEFDFTCMSSSLNPVNVFVFAEIQPSQQNRDFHLIGIESFAWTAAPSIQIAEPSSGISVVEGQGGLKQINVDIALSVVQTITVTVDYSLVDASALASDNDYISQGVQTLTFNSGETLKTISLDIVGDTKTEADEAFQVILSNPSSGLGLSNAQIPVTIVNDDSNPVVSIAPQSIVEGNTGSSVLQFSVSLSNESSFPVIFDYLTSDGSATAPIDYTGISRTTITIPAGSLSALIPVTVLGDMTDEFDESLTLDLSNIQNATFASSTVIGTILNDDIPPNLSIGDVTVDEAVASGLAQFPVSLSAASGKPVTIQLSTASGSALSPDDFAPTIGALTFMPGETNKFIDVPVVNDNVDEPDETFLVNLANSINAGMGDFQGQGTITDEDGVSVTLFANDLTVNEPDGFAMVAVDLMGVTGQVVTVDYRMVNGGALSGQDYTAITGTLTFPAGSNRQWIAIPLLNDAMYELAETLTVNLRNPVNATFSKNFAIVTINDDDPAPFVQFSTASQTVSENVGSATTLTITLSAVAGVGVIVPVTISGTARNPEDHNLTNRNFVIPAGTLSRTFGVPTPIVFVFNDSIDEPDETIVLTMTTPTNAVIGAPGVHTITVQDNDPANVQLSVNDVTVSENVGFAAITVDLMGITEQVVSVNAMTSNGSALVLQDYLATSGVLTFNPGDTQQTIFVPIVNDSIFELTESFNVTLSTPVNALIADGTANINIQEEDSVPTVQFSAASQSVPENMGSGRTFSMTLSAPTSFTVGVPISVSGTASYPSDHSISNGGTFFILAGTTSRTFPFTVTNDSLTEPDETIILSMGAPANVLLGALSNHTITIQDDDALPIVSFQSSTLAFSEGVSTVVVRAVMNRTWPVDVSVPYTVSGTATNGTDHNLDDGILVIGPGLTSVIKTFVVVNDGMDEPAETVILTAGSPTNAVLGSPSVLTVTINDDDAPADVLFELVSQQVSESSGTVAVNVVLSQNSGFDITLPFTVSGSNLPSEHTLNDGFIFIPSGSSSASITFNLIDDLIDEPNETIILTAGTPINATLSGTGIEVINVIDDDESSAVSFIRGHDGLPLSGIGHQGLFGQSLKFSKDGQTAVIGSPGLDVSGGSGRSNGAVYAYRHNAGIWEARGSPIFNGFVTADISSLPVFASTDANEFGRSVDLSPNGDTIVVGAPGAHGPTTTLEGQISVYSWNGSDYELSMNSMSDPSRDQSQFGSSVATDGLRIAVGAPFLLRNAVPVGGVAIYEFDGSQWNLIQMIENPSSTDDPMDRFGASVDIDADTLVISSPGEDSNCRGIMDVSASQVVPAGCDGNELLSDSGALYVYRWSGGAFHLSTFIKTPQPSAGDELGAFQNSANAIALDRRTIVVGAPHEDSDCAGSRPYPVAVDPLMSVCANDDMPESGAAYVYNDPSGSGTWVLETFLKGFNFTTSNANQNFGASVDVLGDIIAIGAPQFDDSSSGVQLYPGGAAFTYSRLDGRWNEWTRLLAIRDFSNANVIDQSDNFGYSVSIGLQNGADPLFLIGNPLDDGSFEGIFDYDGLGISLSNTMYPTTRSAILDNGEQLNGVASATWNYGAGIIYRP